MADCNKTIDFWKEWLRKCEAENNTFILDILSCIKPEEAVKCIQQWSDEHPLPKPKTYADDFFEKFPNTKYDPNRSYTSNGTRIPRVKRCGIYKSCKNVRAFCEAEDQVKCWLEPYNE